MSAGDRVAFGEYVRSRSQALLRAAQAMTGNRTDAEDLLQATLVKAYQSWDRIDDQAALDTYVRRVMVNTHISGWRRRRVDEYPTDELPDSPSAQTPPATATCTTWCSARSTGCRARCAPPSCSGSTTT